MLSPVPLRPVTGTARPGVGIWGRESSQDVTRRLLLCRPSTPSLEDVGDGIPPELPRTAIRDPHPELLAPDALEEGAR